MKEFKFNSDIRSLRIIDEDFGTTLILNGKLDEADTLCIVDLGTSNEVKSVIRNVFENETEIPNVKFPIVENYKHFMIPKKQGVLHLLERELLREGFSSKGILDKRIEYTTEVNTFTPIMQQATLPTRIQEHFDQKINIFFESLESTLGLGVRRYRTTKKNIPFLVVEGIARKEQEFLPETFVQIFESKFPEVKLHSYRISPHKNFKLSFYPSASFITEAMEQSYPPFMNQKIDGYQRVVFEVENINETNILTAKIKHDILASNSGVSYVQEGKTLQIDIPCAYEFGGTQSRAFTERLAYCLGRLEEEYGKVSYEIGKRLPLSFESTNTVFRELTSAPSDLKISVSKFLGTLTEKETKNFFTAGDTERFLLCEEGNYIGLVKKASGNIVKVYHAIEEGYPARDVSSYIPSVLNMGRALLC